MNIKIGKISLPIFALVAAIPRAAKKCRASAADNKDADSPGGSKVTAGEVAEDVLSFLTVLAEEAMPAILAANGISAATNPPTR